MTLNAVIALILRFFTEFDRFSGRLYHNGWRQAYTVCKILFTSSSLPLLAKTITHPAIAEHLVYINHQIPPCGLYSATGLSVSYVRYTASVASECRYIVRLWVLWNRLCLENQSCKITFDKSRATCILCYESVPHGCSNTARWWQHTVSWSRQRKLGLLSPMPSAVSACCLSRSTQGQSPCQWWVQALTTDKVTG